MPNSLRDILKKINALSTCMHDVEIHHAIRGFIQKLNATSYMFSTFLVNAEGQTHTYRFLVGCHPEWIQIYQRRHWYANDPYFQYARCYAAPIAGTEVELSSAGQREMVATAQRYGLRSNLIVPAHARTTALVGVLQVASDIGADAGGEVALMKFQALFRAISGALLEVRIATWRHLSETKFDLNARELEVLKLIDASSPAYEVANALGLSVASIYSMYSKINEKMKVNRITEAVRLAKLHELIA